MKDVTREKIYTFLDKNERKILVCIGLVAFVYFFISFLPSSWFFPDNKIYINRRNLKELEQSFQTAAAIYVAQQRVTPKVFSDFVKENGEIKDKYTISLDEIGDKINSISGLKSNKLTIKLQNHPPSYPNPVATYYLNGYDVTATYENF